MPYHVTKGKGERPWKIKKGNKIVGTSTTKKNALASIAHREGAESKDIKKYKRTTDNKMRDYGETDLEKKTVRINKSKKKNKKPGDILDTIVHEKMHIRHPKKLERTVRKETKKVIKKMGKKLKAKHYSLFKK